MSHTRSSRLLKNLFGVSFRGAKRRGIALFPGIVLNRKNSLFVGNPRGGRTAAILASLTSTCRRHEVDPQLYLPNCS
jgi:hypothetical protein